MCNSILTIYVLIYIIAQGKFCLKRVTRMNNQTTLK